MVRAKVAKDLLMAISLAMDSYATVTIAIRDRGGVSQCMFHIASESGAAPLPYNDNDWSNFLQELSDNIESVSDCIVTGAGMNIGWSASGSAGYGANPNVERKGVFQFNTAAGFPGIVTIPGINDAAIAEDGMHIRRTGAVFEGTLATPLQAFHDKMQNGATVNLLGYAVTDRRGSDFNGLIDAYQQHRRNNRG